MGASRVRTYGHCLDATRRQSAALAYATGALLFALLLGLSLGLPAQAQAKTRGPKTAGALAVKDGKLVDAKGKATVLHGVSTHGLAWYGQYVNNKLFHELRASWGANVVRLAMYTEEYGGYCAGGDKKALRSLVIRGARLAKKNNLYAIVDWHILSDGNPLTHVKEARQFFKTVSKALGDTDHVIYEICNEPNGGTTWAQIRAYAKKVIPVIRANDPDAIILVGTPTWSQEIDKAQAKPLSYKNVMYTLHFYAATHKEELRNRMVDAVKAGLPVFVSEFGICDASGSGSIDKASANAWVSTMKKYKVSWCMWSLCNKAETASIIKSNCNATSGFGTKNLTTTGKWLLKALKGTLPKGTVATGSQDGGGSSASTSTAQKRYRFTCGKLACTATLTSSWQSGKKTCYQYELSIQNKGAARSSWSVDVPFNKKVSLASGWNGGFKASGKTLRIRNLDYNGSLAKGATLTGIGFQVLADKGLSIS